MVKNKYILGQIPSDIPIMYVAYSTRTHTVSSGAGPVCYSTKYPVFNRYSYLPTLLKIFITSKWIVNKIFS